VTPQFYALSKGYANIENLLLENNANVNAVNRGGVTPFYPFLIFCQIFTKIYVSKKNFFLKLRCTKFGGTRSILFRMSTQKKQMAMLTKWGLFFVAIYT